MTSHAELSRDLALAIGYAPESVRIMPTSAWPGMSPNRCEVYRHTGGADEWCEFDYRSPTVAMPPLKWRNGTPAEATSYAYQAAMLSAAAIDLAGVAVRVPEPMLNDIGSTYTRGWNACLDALGVK